MLKLGLCSVGRVPLSRWCTYTHVYTKTCLDRLLRPDLLVHEAQLRGGQGGEAVHRVDAALAVGQLHLFLWGVTFMYGVGCECTYIIYM